MKRTVIKDSVSDSKDSSIILRTLSISEGFHFYKGLGEPTLIVATGLSSFSEKLKSVDLMSIDFHFKRGDFEKWVSNTIVDPVLSERMSKIEKDIQGEVLRQKLIALIDDRVHELSKTEPARSAQYKRERTRKRRI